MGFWTGQLRLAGTADVDAVGTFTCASTAGVYPGQEGWLNAATQDAQAVIVVAVLSSTKLTLKKKDLLGPQSANGFQTAPNYGTSNFGAAYSVVNGVTLDFDGQVVPGRTTP